jgi:subtilisin family serine protease
MKRYFVVAPRGRHEMVKQGISAKGRADEAASLRHSVTQPGTAIAYLSPETADHLATQGMTLYEDVQFQIFDASVPSDPSAQYWQSKSQPTLEPADVSQAVGAANLSAVMEQVNAPAAWAITKGAGATIAVVDSGVAASLHEFAASRRSTVDVTSAYQGRHWQDGQGHGSMCAAIAAGSKADGGRYDGVAPEATILAVRTDFTATDLFLIYEDLIQAKANGTLRGPLVISNSYGLYRYSSDNVLQQDHPYLKNVLAAVDAGIVVIFAAGNNHANLCNLDPSADSPNTIWSVNSHDRVISVGTVDRNGSNQTPPSPHVNSSRGPGEWSVEHKKPDVVCPTYGEVVWGEGYRTMEWWGSSGACPQVAGLAALLMTVAPGLAPDKVGDIIRNSARNLHAPANCVGHGIIDCGAAVAQVTAGV